MPIYEAVTLAVVFGVVLIGIFRTKTPGFGRYTTSLLLLVLVVFVAALGFSAGRIEMHPFLNLLFAVAGYAGGLITARESQSA